MNVVCGTCLLVLSLVTFTVCQCSNITEVQVIDVINDLQNRNISQNNITLKHWHINCLAAASTHDEYSWVTFVAYYAKNSLLEMAQIVVPCSNNHWNVSSRFGNITTISNDTYNQLIAKPTRTDCYKCSLSSINLTDAFGHCIECDHSCKVGAMRCFNNTDTRCCRYYRGNNCSLQCGTNEYPDEDFACMCNTFYNGSRFNICSIQFSDCKNGGVPDNTTCLCQCNSTEYQGPICIDDINECNFSNRCQNAGSCININGSYICYCATGYTGDNCSININDCNPNLCDNGGTCVDGIADYTCECPTGYTDQNCSTKIDECEPNLCDNGGTCVDGIADYTCECATGYTDQNCSTNIDECEPNPCESGGTCVDGIANYTCECIIGYTDQNCSTNIDECEPNPCESGGTCVDGIANYTCECAVGYTDQNCSTNIDECEPNPCENEGTCVDRIADYICKCVVGYSDKNCSTNIDDCEQSPCKNGGTCLDGIAAYTCECAKGYTGQNCSTNIDNCEPNPCENGGNCTDRIANFTCNCSSGFQGYLCHQDIDECITERPCGNRGICNNFHGGFECVCHGGWSGQLCTSCMINNCSQPICSNTLASCYQCDIGFSLVNGHCISCEINDCLLCLTKNKCAICNSGFVLADNGITCKIFNTTSPTVRPTSDYKISGLNTIATIVFCIVVILLVTITVFIVVVIIVLRKVVTKTSQMHSTCDHHNVNNIEMSNMK